MKCSVRSMFSCCFAFAIFVSVLCRLFQKPGKQLALLRRAAAVFTCDWDLTGRRQLVHASGGGAIPVWHEYQNWQHIISSCHEQTGFRMTARAVCDVETMASQQECTCQVVKKSGLTLHSVRLPRHQNIQYSLKHLCSKTRLYNATVVHSSHHDHVKT